VVIDCHVDEYCENRSCLVLVQVVGWRSAKGIGDKTTVWIARIGKKFSNIGLEVGKVLVTKWLMQYLGLDD